MRKHYLVVESVDDWKPYAPTEQLISFRDYLQLPETPGERISVINLAREYGYLKPGYYCSLLAEARGHRVIPGTAVLNDLAQPLLYEPGISELARLLRKLPAGEAGETRTFVSYFGQVEDPALLPLARALFAQFAAPVLQIRLQFNVAWRIDKLELVSHTSLDEAGQDAFAAALEVFSSSVWKPRPKKKEFRHDLAILVNPEEKLPPSNEAALNKFIKAAARHRINAEIIHPSDFARLGEFDALFIRETTSLEDHTYRFSKRAQAEGLVVIDDPDSILRCTNKVYLARLFQSEKVPAPETRILDDRALQGIDSLADDLGLPIILKIPDGSFSRGIHKVDTKEELATQLAEMLQHSSLIIAQEFLYTDYDWRIGVLNNRAIYACRYYMVKKHWQIYQHGARTKSGGFDTMPTFEVPKPVIQAALKACKPIGDGLYGVDVKESNGKAYVIEVNDNPSLESGVEDQYLGNDLYDLIMEEFADRLEQVGN